MKAFALAFGWSVAGIFAIAVAGNSGPQLAEITSTPTRTAEAPK